MFLGEWCRRFTQRDSWEHLEHKTVPYRWNDRDLMYSDYLYLQNLYEECLDELVVILNKIHQRDWARRSWEIVVISLAEF